MWATISNHFEFVVLLSLCLASCSFLAWLAARVAQGAGANQNALNLSFGPYKLGTSSIIVALYCVAVGCGFGLPAYYIWANRLAADDMITVEGTFDAFPKWLCIQPTTAFAEGDTFRLALAPTGGDHSFLIMAPEPYELPRTLSISIDGIGKLANVMLSDSGTTYPPIEIQNKTALVPKLHLATTSELEKLPGYTAHEDMKNVPSVRPSVDPQLSRLAPPIDASPLISTANH
jgi:hypothetical protein